MSTLLRIASESHTTYINLDTIHVITHDRKQQAYSLNVILVDGNYSEIDTVYTFSKCKDPVIYEQIKTYVKKRCSCNTRSSDISSKKSTTLVSLDT